MGVGLRLADIQAASALYAQDSRCDLRVHEEVLAELGGSQGHAGFTRPCGYADSS